MKHVLHFDLLNIDHVYQVEHFVQPGETLDCAAHQPFAGDTFIGLFLAELPSSNSVGGALASGSHAGSHGGDATRCGRLDTDPCRACARLKRRRTFDPSKAAAAVRSPRDGIL